MMKNFILAPMTIQLTSNLYKNPVVTLVLYVEIGNELFSVS